tara:strand:- start:1164 stop:1553 length:390 start_codon:yes stop_codon:yes gene_type:complete
MKIFGLGTDIVNTRRFSSILNRGNMSFKKRIYSKSEILLCEKRKDKTSCFAKRFAAKEAFSKSLGTGIAKGLNFTEIEVKKNDLGLPYFKIRGSSLKTVYKILKKKNFKVYLSLSDDKPFVVATVILCI